MSRHRNMKHLIADDDYDDDYYYDDYDDYDDTSYRPAVKTNTKKTNNNNNSSNKKQPVKTKLTPSKTTSPATQVVVSPVTPRHTNKTPPPSTTTTPTTTITTTPPKPQTLPAILKPPPNDSTTRVPLTVVVLGHVDAGKSTITGHLLSVQQQQQHSVGRYNNNNNKSIPYAWLLDEDEQERQHGITMGIATKQLTTQSRFQIILQDAPGHADYIPAMITGTQHADCAILVVDVTGGGTGPPQLIEHAYLARGLGVTQILVLLNKMDIIEWNQDRYQQAVEDLTKLLIGKIGFAAHKVRWVPVSGVEGDNLKTKPPPATGAWYSGPTVWQALDDFEVPPSQQEGSKVLEKPARVIVTDVLNEQGRGGVAVRVKMVQGWIQAGEPLVVLPIGDPTTMTKFSSLTASVAGYETSPQRSQYAAVGELLDAVVNQVDITRLSTGNILCRPDERPPLAQRCIGKIWIMDNLTVPIIRGAQAIFHMHQLDVPCNIAKLIRTYQKDGVTTAKERPRALIVNQQAQVELSLITPICMESFADCRALGRFVLRRGGESIAVGRIERVLG